MYCPRCGQQQATDSMRFCSRCGFSMEGTMHLLAHGGMLPVFPQPVGEKNISPRRKGVKQGGALMILGAIIVPIFGVMAGFAPGRLDNLFAFFAALSAVICFVGGPLRMLFAAVFEEGAPAPMHFTPQMNYNVPASLPSAHVSALPPPAVNPVSQWRQRPDTGEIQPPASVTDSTTKLLDREPRRE
jgi:hypothetical protein